MGKRKMNPPAKQFLVRKKISTGLCRWGTLVGWVCSERGASKPRLWPPGGRGSGSACGLGACRGSYMQLCYRPGLGRAWPWEPSAPRAQPCTSSRTCRR